MNSLLEQKAEKLEELRLIQHKIDCILNKTVECEEFAVSGCKYCGKWNWKSCVICGERAIPTYEHRERRVRAGDLGSYKDALLYSTRAMLTKKMIKRIKNKYDDDEDDESNHKIMYFTVCEKPECISTLAHPIDSSYERKVTYWDCDCGCR